MDSGDGQLDTMLRFIGGVMRASAVGMVWVDIQCRMTYANKFGLDDEMMREYIDNMHQYDPLSPEKLISSKKKISELPILGRTYGIGVSDKYSQFLSTYGIVDEVDFVFWQKDEPIAIVGVMKRDCDPPLARNREEWEVIRDYLELNIQHHPRVRQRTRAANAMRRFNLTLREIEVVALLEKGATNDQIAHNLGISLATTKSHVVNMLDKMGAQNRLSVVSIFNSI